MTSSHILLDDERWMREALAWSERGRGWTSPRPSVGCVLVRDGVLLGGAHTHPGHSKPHAEVAAIQAARAAGYDLRGATAFVTLEPCSHQATTPPCTQALIEAGITRAVCGVLDPNPHVNGRGYQMLREAGIEVVEGVLERECARAQEDFLHHIVHRTPFVTLKCAVSLDGKIALASGESKWITGALARERAHQLRHQHDVVLCGVETILHDDPMLDVRLEGRWKQPVRVVLDSRGRIPVSACVLHNASGGRTLVASTEQMPERARRALQEQGAEVLVLPFSSKGVNWSALLSVLYGRELCPILIEGGARVGGSALHAGIVQKAAFFVAPLLMGEGRQALDGVRFEHLAEAPRLHDVEIERLGDDVLVSGYL